MKKAFTIIELLVAMGLLSVLIAISGMVFSTAVKAHRAANATGEIAAKLQAFTRQLDADFGNGHLQKDGEFLIVWAPMPQLNLDGSILNTNGDNFADHYLSFDQILFFTGNGEQLQSYNEQTTISGGTKPVYSTDARLCYSFGRDAKNMRAYNEPNPVKRMVCRTQHLITADSDLPLWPDLSVTWNPDDFVKKNFWDNVALKPGYEYQTMDKTAWINIPFGSIKKDMLTAMLDVPFDPSAVTPGCPQIDLTSPQRTAATVPQLFMQGVGQFRVQVWRSDLTPNRWYPEIDLNGDGDYADTDYPVQCLDLTQPKRYVLVFLVPYWNTFSQIGPALKFTFTLYDSNGVFPEGKTFTYIVYMN
jgi:prepilin-type N-terminal cleavage/methylation domain-containing protein